MGKQASDNVFSRMFTSAAAPKKESQFTTLSTSSDVFVKVALELLQNAQSAKRNEILKNEIKSSFIALEAASKDSKNMLIIFKPFQTACQSKNSELISISVDCLGKLFTYNFWGEYDLNGINSFLNSNMTGNSVLNDEESESIEESETKNGTSQMIAFVIGTICESCSMTDEKVDLQIIKALQAATSTSESAYCLHGNTLIKAIKTTFNICLLSTSTNVQTVAQGALTQMIQNVYGRIPKVIEPEIYEKKLQTDLEMENTKKVVLSEFPIGGNQNSVFEVNLDRQLKDAYQVLLMLTKLSMNSLQIPEGTMDLRSTSIRSKLLSLHMIYSILSSHSYVFLQPANNLIKELNLGNFGNFIDAVKIHLCPCITRNAVSVVPQILDISIEIFGRIVSDLRHVLKKEISVIFTEIIISIIETKKQFTFHQKSALLIALNTVFSDPKTECGRIFVEIYLNYDCDVEAGARENIWERLITSISKSVSQFQETGVGMISATALKSIIQNSSGNHPALSTGNLINFSRDQVKELYSTTGDSTEFKKLGIQLIVTGILKPLVSWCKSRTKPIPNNEQENEDSLNSKLDEGITTIAADTKLEFDDPKAFENKKHQKKAFIEGIKNFNIKPKKGIQYLLETGCISARTPEMIAKFLLKAEGLNKGMIGEYLGDGDDENIAIMHSFVDQMHFKDLKFIDALRFFLQSFRLPGEAQKIDRFMLKFADRYLKENSNTFSSADTAYVLAYSVIMLNTDQHNAQVKKKMTKSDFLKNNRGIDEGKDLPVELLESIFDEIQTNEIVMKDEHESKNKAAVADSRSTNQQFVNITGTIAMKSEAMFKSNKSDAREFITANHYQHVKPMFSSIWMSLLTALSNTFQETEDVESNLLILEGFKYCIYISCLFEMDLERKTFMSTLCKYTSLSQIDNIKPKNIEAIKFLLEIANTEGDKLNEDWKDVATCISQLEKLQLYSQNNYSSQDENKVHSKQNSTTANDRRTIKSNFVAEASAAANSQGMTILVDRIFTGSVLLSGKAIVFFVKALSQISWDEITSSSSSKLQPRMYCLQRLIEISYYNMNRVRMEWSHLWAILGEHFVQVGSSSNSTVTFFAIDKLRQLAMKFLELEELSNFKFQKDFLKPYEEIFSNNPDIKIKDMVLACLQQMVQAKSKNMKSGWKTIFSTLSRATNDSNESIVLQSFEILKLIFKTGFDCVFSTGMFADYIVCIVEFSKVSKFPKISLHAVDLLRLVVQKITEINQNTFQNTESTKIISSKSIENIYQLIQAAPISPNSNALGGIKFVNDQESRYWLPVLLGMSEIILKSELEVRTKALNFLFDTLKNQGPKFTKDFWELIIKTVLLPLFNDLRTSEENLSKKEERSVWISTTLIQALRQFVDMFIQLFETISFIIDDLLDLLHDCLIHENETLSRIGATCLQQMIEGNYQKLNSQNWDKISKCFQSLFDQTTPYSLFCDLSNGKNGDSPKSITGRPLLPQPQKHEFQKLIAKCIQHLLVLQNLTDILTNQNLAVYKSLGSEHKTIFLDLFESSYFFAKEFNGNYPLRDALLKIGFMQQIPNLLKQETSSVSALIVLLSNLYNQENTELDPKVEAKLIPICLDIIKNFNDLSPDSNRRSLNAWRPVIVLILGSLSEFNNEYFMKHIPGFYESIVGLLSQDLPAEMRTPLTKIFSRIGSQYSIIPEKKNE